jgi:hypothetical protein
VVELSNDELEGLITSVIVTASAGPSDPGPSIPWVIVVPDTSGDYELARKLFIDFNQEAIGIPGDEALVDLVSDEDSKEPDANKAEEDTATGDEEEEGTTVDDEPSEQGVMSPSPPPSA